MFRPWQPFFRNLFRFVPGVLLSLLGVLTNDLGDLLLHLAFVLGAVLLEECVGLSLRGGVRVWVIEQMLNTSCEN